MKLKMIKEEPTSSSKHQMESVNISPKKIRYFSANKTKKDKTDFKSKRVRKRTKKLTVASKSSNTPKSECPKSPHTLLIDKVQSSVNAALRYNEEKSSKKKPSLFVDEKQPIYLAVECIKIPRMPKRNFRFCLPHPLIDKSSDVCLFVPDLKKGKREDHEPTKEYYKDILQKNNISGISEVIPLRQLRVEYDQFELRRRLVDQFDLFLSDGRISGHILHLLGKEAYRKRKLPVPVDMRVQNLIEEVKRALTKTIMMMHGTGRTCSLKIGHTQLSAGQIAENIMSVAKDLAQHYPGGWANIRSLDVHMQEQPLIPVYINFKSSNEVKVPVVKPVVPKKAVPVEGELSTFPGTRVTVMPDGEVIVKRVKTKEDLEMDISDSDWEDLDSDKEIDVEKGDDGIVKETPVDDSLFETEEKEEEEDKDEDPDSNENDQSEHIAEAAENAYLNEWSKQWNESINDTQKQKKRKQMENDTNDDEITKKKKKTKEFQMAKKKSKNIQKIKQKKSKGLKKIEDDANDEEPTKKKNKRARNKSQEFKITEIEPKNIQEIKQKKNKDLKKKLKDLKILKKKNDESERSSSLSDTKATGRQKKHKMKHNSKQSFTKKE